MRTVTTLIFNVYAILTSVLQHGSCIHQEDSLAGETYLKYSSNFQRFCWTPVGDWCWLTLFWFGRLRWLVTKDVNKSRNARVSKIILVIPPQTYESNICMSHCKHITDKPETWLLVLEQYCVCSCISCTIVVITVRLPLMGTRL